MNKIIVGNAPCSWGALEFDGLEGKSAAYGQVLDEMAATGYCGTELGDWGFMPTDGALLRDELTRRNLLMLGAFVPIGLGDLANHAAGAAHAIKTARLLGEVAAGPIHPFLVLADDNGTDTVRTSNAGRVTPQMGLSSREWRIFAQGAEEVARVVREESGLRTVFHHHCAGHIETPDEIQRLLEMTDPSLLGLVLDTGHYAYGAGSSEGVLDAFRRYADRIWHVHFKDCSPIVASAARTESLDYFEAVKRGVFCELGKGSVDFKAVALWLKEHGYSGAVVVEQDVLPGMGTPKESARRNRDYLKSIGL
jgi:inosose dehydratase